MRALILGALCCLAAAGSPAWAQVSVPEGSRFHNGATLPLAAEGPARRLMSRFEEAIAVADVDEVAAVIRDMRRLDEVRRINHTEGAGGSGAGQAASSELSVPGPLASMVRFGRRTWVPALDLALRRVAGSLQPALKARVEADAAASVARARQDHDVEALMHLAALAPTLDAGREAALGAARLLFERGQWWPAASLAARARPLKGAAEMESAARRRLQAAWPTASGAPSVVAGDGPAEVPLVSPDDLTWSFGFGRWLDGVSGHGLPLVTSGRIDAAAGRDELLVLYGLGLLGLDREVLSAPPEKRASDPPSRPALLPAGKLGWLNETLPDRAWPHPGLSFGKRNVAWPQPHQLSMVRRGQRLITPFNLVRRDPPQADHYPREAWLLALDLDAPDRPAWLTPAPSLGDSGDDQSAAFGPPLLVGERVFCQLFRTGLSTTVSLVAFDVADGRLLFETPLARGDQIDRYASRRAFTDWWDLDKRAREGPPAERRGMIYVCTGFGVVAAVDGLTGRLAHTFHYDRLFSLDPDTYDRSYLVDTGGWDDEPVRLWDDRVVVAPSDSSYLYVLGDRPGPEGQLIRDDPVERLWRRHLVGLLPDPGGSASPALLFSELRGGRFRLELRGPGGALLEAGAPLPQGESVDRVGPPGRPLLVGGAEGWVFVPTSVGVRAYRVADLGADPVLLDRPQGMPPVMSVQNLPQGLAALSVHPTREQMFVECWTARP